VTVRRRPRRRARGVVVDSTTALDLKAFDPVLELGPVGQTVWDLFADDTPFWWDAADIPMVSVMCSALDAVEVANSPDSTEKAAGRAAIFKEWRSLADQLGLSPTSRGRLKMTEAQGVVAAKKVEAMEDSRARQKKAQAMDLDELAGDD